MVDSQVRNWQLGPASEPVWEAALTLLFGTTADGQPSDHATRLLKQAQQGGLSLAGLLVAQRGERLVGAGWAQVVSPSAAIAWPPRLVPGEDPVLADALLTAMLQELSSRGVGLAQTLLPCDASDEIARFQAAGFQHLAELAYLVSLPGEFPAELPEGDLQFEPFAPDKEARLATVVEATYQQSLDCAPLNGVRPVGDVLAEYRQAGEYDPSRWFIVRYEQHDVGCLLLADYPNTSQYELVYMGLVPEARGQGWGMTIVRCAQAWTRRAGRKRLLVAVDAGNTPALALYFASGFTEYDRRSAWIKIAKIPEDSAL